jgi:hypothetical protein
MATLITPDGTHTEVQPANGKVFTLTELQTLVGGFIESVVVVDHRVMFVDEDGRMKRLPPNPEATMVAGNIAQMLVGNALLCTLKETGDER